MHAKLHARACTCCEFLRTYSYAHNYTRIYVYALCVVITK